MGMGVPHGVRGMYQNSTDGATIVWAPPASTGHRSKGRTSRPLLA
jgi:hypothetical protein